MIRPARPASTVCLLRDGSIGPEVLMVRRGRTARFMGGTWVFPGGVVDDIDHRPAVTRCVVGAPDGEMPWRAAGLRELAEEVHIWVTRPQLDPLPSERLMGPAVYEALQARAAAFDAGRLAYFANWITPTMIPARFDTRFYAALADEGSIADPDPAELDAAEWIRPSRAMEDADAGERTIPFPTLKTLAFLSGFSSAAEVTSHALALPAVQPILPRGRLAGDGSIEVVLPGEEGYDDLADDPPDREALADITRSAGPAGSLVELADGES